VPDPRVESKTLALRRQGMHRPKLLEAGPFAADVASFRLHLAAENKAAGTVRTCTASFSTLWCQRAKTASSSSSGVIPFPPQTEAVNLSLHPGRLPAVFLARRRKLPISALSTGSPHE
jgi:hypothetical protein